MILLVYIPRRKDIGRCGFIRNWKPLWHAKNKYINLKSPPRHMQKQIKINNDMITYETRGQKENDKNDKTHFYFTMSTTSTNNMCTLPIFQK